MKILVIGGTGHMGSFLVPMLLEEGHEVYIATRGKNVGIRNSKLERAKFIRFDTRSDEDILSLKEYKFDVIVDFPGNVYRIWQLIGNDVAHIVACGSLWMFGKPRKVPTPPEYQNECPFDVYSKRGKEIFEMAEKSGKGHPHFTAIMPPNVAGPGKIPIDMYGDRNIENHRAHMRGEEVILPEGADALISPCDAEDIARLFDLAINNREASAGEIFNVGSGESFTATELCRIFGEIYGVDIPVRYVSFNEYCEKINPDQGAWWHFYAHMCPDFSKSVEKLGYKPKYTVKESLTRAIDWMKKEELI
jgi:nucleoside-diphosphate-sugar epimerase